MLTQGLPSLSARARAFYCKARLNLSQLTHRMTYMDVLIHQEVNTLYLKTCPLLPPLPGFTARNAAGPSAKPTAVTSSCPPSSIPCPQCHAHTLQRELTDATLGKASLQSWLSRITAKVRR